MADEEYYEETLEKLTYRDLQLRAKALGFPCNVKKVHLIKLLVTFFCKTQQECDLLVEMIKLERTMKKPRKRGIKPKEPKEPESDFSMDTKPDLVVVKEEQKPGPSTSYEKSKLTFKDTKPDLVVVKEEQKPGPSTSYEKSKLTFKDTKPELVAATDEQEPGPSTSYESELTFEGTRKSTRATRYKSKTPAPTTSKPPAPQGRGRRSIFKRPPLKAPTATATVVTSDFVFYKGFYWQKGDIVSVIDVAGGTYYAQIRGFLTDEYCEKSAVLTWLIPTKASPPPAERFEAATYLYGFEEDLPRKLEFMEFVMHVPSNYYYDSTTPYPPMDKELNDCTGFIWTSLNPKDRS